MASRSALNEREYMESIVNQEFIDYKQLAKKIGLPMGTLYCLVSKQEIPHHRLGRRLVRFSLLEIENWLRARQVTIKNNGGDNECTK